MTDAALAALIVANYTAIMPPGSAAPDPAYTLPLAKAINAAVGGASANHSALSQLDYASAGHTGFQPDLGYTPEDVANKDTDGTLSANSDTKYPSQKAVKTYADQLIGAANAAVYKGVVDCSTNPNYPAADCGHLYFVSVAGKIGGASGINVEVGDMLICNTDSTPSGDQATVGAYWNIIQKNLDGAVIGPASSTDEAIAIFDGVTGKIIKDSAKTIVTTLGADDTTVPTSKAVQDAISGPGLPDGDDKLLGSRTIDNITYNVDTDYDIYTPSGKDAIINKLFIYNGNSTEVAKVRVAYHDGSLADEDYLLYDISIGPKSNAIVIEIATIKDGDSISIRSDITDVVFTLTGEETTDDYGADREGAEDIDGTTNAVDTDIDLATFTSEKEVDVTVCNRNSADTINYILTLYDGSTDYIIDEGQVLPNQSVVIAYDINVANTYKIKVQSDTTNVSFACFSRGTTLSNIDLLLPAEVQLKRVAETHESFMTIYYDTQSTWENVTGLIADEIVSPGYYDISSLFTNQINATTEGCYFRLAINGNAIEGTQQLEYFNNAGSETLYSIVALIKDKVYLEAGDIVSVQAKYLSSSTRVYYAAGESVGSLKVVQTETLVDYVKNPYQVDYYQIELSVSATNWTTYRAVGLAYKDPNGNWRFKFNIVGILSVASTSVTLTISGVTFKNSSNYYQPISTGSGNAFRSENAYANPNASTIYGKFTDNETLIGFSGDVELEEKPSWV